MSNELLSLTKALSKAAKDHLEVVSETVNMSDDLVGLGDSFAKPPFALGFQYKTYDYRGEHTYKVIVIGD